MPRGPPAEYTQRMRPFVRVVGVTLLAGCAKPPDPGPGNPPEPEGGTASSTGTIPEVGQPGPPGGPELLHPGPGQLPTNPPLPPKPPPVMPTANPPAPLPTWDQVPSHHPPGATNPPFPVLVVARDTGACYKEWMGGMVPPPAKQRAAGGLVLETSAELAERSSTQIQCPEGEPADLIQRWDHPEPRR